MGEETENRRQEAGKEPRGSMGAGDHQENPARVKKADGWGGKRSGGWARLKQRGS